MTSAFLQSELTSLIADSKKRSSDVRSAAEKAFADLKAIAVTSENQLAADLSRRPDFIEPFVLACRAKNAKLANSAVTCLQRLVASKSVAEHRLGDVLTAYQDVANIGYDVQLKILQTLPALLQLYATQVHGRLLADILDLCASLQTSRTDLVSSSAGATLEQLIASVFEEAIKESNGSSGELDEGDEDSGNRKSTSADDASRIFEDFCSLLNQSDPTFLRSRNLSTIYLLDTLEHLLRDHSLYVKNREYLLEACRVQLIPGLQALLLKKDDFYCYLHICRMSWTLLLKLPTVTGDIGNLLSSILAFAERDRGPPWKRLLSLELAGKICSNLGVTLRVARTSKAGKSSVVSDLMAVLVRIASEDPTLIGLGRQSTMPLEGRQDAKQEDMASIEAQGVGGGLTSVSSADGNGTGVSARFSTLEAPLMDDGDPTNLATVPKTYLYILVLDCISSLCEGLSKFIMPLSITRRQAEGTLSSDDEDTEDGGQGPSLTPKSRRRANQFQRYQRLMNPLKMEQTPRLAQVEECAELIDACWPAVLAACSTFLNASLDSHFYHILIRSMQKLAQVSGTLELSTPRDALLTSLAKGSVPSNATAIFAAVQRKVSGAQARTGTNGVRSPTEESPGQSTNIGMHSLNVRHLLCLRALLNLGIALGPTLSEQSWFILIETLQQDEGLMSIASTSRKVFTPTIGSSDPTDQGGQSSLAAEMSSVNAAAKKMFESTRSFTNDKIFAVVKALFKLLGDSPAQDSVGARPADAQSPASLKSPTLDLRKHRTSRSVSSIWQRTHATDVEVSFVLAKVKELARVNLHRFTSGHPQANLWDVIVTRLLNIYRDTTVSNELRLQSASVIDLLAKETLKLLKPEAQTRDELTLVQTNCLNSLLAQIEPDHDRDVSPESPMSLSTDARAHVFEALEDVLGYCGESLDNVWSVVFRILDYSFDEANTESTQSGAASQPRLYEYAAYTPSAFRCAQLICNDFMQYVDEEALGRLVVLLQKFGAQDTDLNMALAATSLIRAIVSHSQDRLDSIGLSEGNLVLADNTGTDIASTSLSTWSLALSQLINQCQDPRQDVRDAGVRILLEAFQSASDKIDKELWSSLFANGPFLILDFYEQARSRDSEASRDWQSSSTNLLEAMTNLIEENINAIATALNFNTTWPTMLHSLEKMLEGAPLSHFNAVYQALSRVLIALRNIRLERSSFVDGALRLWMSRPVPLTEATTFPESNQAAITSYLNMFVEACRIEAKLMHILEAGRDDFLETAQARVSQSVLGAVHPQYTNDVKILSSEQKAACDALQILKTLYVGRMGLYAERLLGLIKETHTTVKSSHHSTVSKWVQHPKLIAVCAKLVDMFRDLAAEQHDDIKLLQHGFGTALHVMSEVINTKYADIPTNAESPLWQHATKAAVAIAEAIQRPASMDPDILSHLGTSLISTTSSLLHSRDLSLISPMPLSLESDEVFDTTHFQRLHTASLPILSHPSIPNPTRKSYILTIFHASLIARPWHLDFPSRSLLSSAPLTNLTTIRAGSVHDPVFVPRQQVAYTALSTLFSFVDPTSATFNTTMAKEAVPYLLLRICHSLKTFMADQPLRGLTPLPRPYQRELKWLFDRCVELRCDDAAFAEALEKEVQDRDGKTLLRVLYSMMLSFKKRWEKEVMRAPDGMAWQDDADGEGVEKQMERWIEVVGEGWGL